MCPHEFHQLYEFRAPGLPQTRDGWPLLFGSNNIIDRVFVHSLQIVLDPALHLSCAQIAHLPGELLRWVVPLEHLPEDHGTREHVNFVVIFGVRAPEFRCLPVDGADETANHRSRRLLDFRQAKVGNLRRDLAGDKNIGTLAVPMNY
jgi:hypothetical protein